ncbi:antibiotic biosynthesis monooxygenase (plasmid) [Streptomyces sp. NBC_00435]|uniref:antibiotic biosynthesis monooxygenase family protein n=1 Tax=Streptomyces sp. NBC_00435 TaxID=2903649 RepID=UPI002E1CC481
MADSANPLDDVVIVVTEFPTGSGPGDVPPAYDTSVAAFRHQDGFLRHQLLQAVGTGERLGVEWWRDGASVSAAEPLRTTPAPALMRNAAHAEPRIPEGHPSEYGSWEVDVETYTVRDAADFRRRVVALGSTLRRQDGFRFWLLLADRADGDRVRALSWWRDADALGAARSAPAVRHRRAALADSAGVSSRHAVNVVYGDAESVDSAA